MSKDKETVKEKSSGRSKVLTALGIVLCVILLPILIVNVTMIIKSYTNPEEYPSFAGYNLMIVLSPSMEETIMPGDLILVKNEDPENIEGESSAGAQDGDIISFFDPDSDKQSVLTHRCVKVNDDGSFTTKGDNNMSEDPTHCPSDNLIGTYITRIPGAGSVAMWLQTTPGLIVCVAVPIVLLVAYDLIMKKRYDKTKKKDTDDLLAELEALRAQQSEVEEKKESDAKAKAEEADAKAEEAPAPKDKSKEKTEDKSDDTVENADSPSAEKQSEEKKEEKASGGKSAEDSVTTTMTAEELEQFREFQKMKNAQKDSEPKDAE